MTDYIYDLGTYRRPVTTRSADAQAWFDRGLNNARLALVATYHDLVPGFERLLAEHGADLARFHAAVEELARQPRPARAVRLRGSAPPP